MIVQKGKEIPTLEYKAKQTRTYTATLTSHSHGRGGDSKVHLTTVQRTQQQAEPRPELRGMACFRDNYYSNSPSSRVLSAHNLIKTRQNVQMNSKKTTRIQAQATQQGSNDSRDRVVE